MTGQQLKNSILQEAIQGRLVPNVLEPGERTGAELLQDILAERQKKENEEKGKKAKKLTLSIVEDEPWELPDGWCWCKLGDLSDRLVGKTPERANTAYWSPENMPWVSISDMKDYGEVKSTKESVSALAEKDVFHNRVSKKGSLIMSFKLTVGRTCILGIDAYHNEAIITFLLPEWLDTLKTYLFWLLPVFTNTSDSKDAVKGKTLNKDSINSTDIPLPPLSIQKAIVDKIESLLPLVDEYDKAAGELKTLNEALPDKLHKSVLQEAIHGKLVPNDIPEGEATAPELLQRILKERQDREDKEKGKKAKKLTLSIVEDEPWELPDGWCWCKLGDIILNRDSERIPLSVEVRSRQIKKLYDYYGPGGAFDKVEGYLFDKRLLLIGEDGANLLTRSKPNAFFAEGKYWVNNHVHVLDSLIPDTIILDYIALRINGMSLADYVTGTAQPKMNQEKMNSIPIPLPPLSIQHRIVEKIDKLFATIDKL